MPGAGTLAFQFVPVLAFLQCQHSCSVAVLTFLRCRHCYNVLRELPNAAAGAQPVMWKTRRPVQGRHLEIQFYHVGSTLTVLSQMGKLTSTIQRF